MAVASMRAYYYNGYQREVNFIEVMQLINDTDLINYIFENKVREIDIDENGTMRFEWED